MARPENNPAFTFRGFEYWIADVGADRPGIDSEKTVESAALELTLKVDWDIRKDAHLALVGGTVFVPSLPQYGYLARTLPHCFTGEETWLWCKSARLSPLVSREAGANGVPGALFATIKTRYEPRTYRLLEDGDSFGGEGIPDESQLIRYVSFPPPRGKDRVLKGRPGAWRFVDRVEAIPDLDSVGVVNETEEFIVWHQVPVANLPKAAMAACWRCSNATAFNGHAAGTLAFNGYSWKELPCLSNGTLAVDVYYSFLSKPRGANFFPDTTRADSPYIEVVSSAGGAGKPHPPIDFERLFRPVAA